MNDKIIASLREENTQLKDNWNELEEYIKANVEYYKDFIDTNKEDFTSTDFKTFRKAQTLYEEILNKMQEIKESKNE